MDDAGANELEDLAISSLSVRLRPLIHRLSRALRGEAVTSGFSSVDFTILMFVRMSPGIGVSELAAQEGMSHPSMSSHVKRLRNAGWLAIQEVEGGDKRKTPLVLTAAGSEVADVMRARSSVWLSQQLRGLTLRQRRDLEAALPAIEALLQST